FGQILGVDSGSSAIAVLLEQGGELVFDDRPQFFLALEDRADLLGPLALVVELLADLEDLELGELVEPGLEHRVGLDLGQIEGPGQLAGGVGLAVALADQLDGAIELVEELFKALEDVDALIELAQGVLEAAANLEQAKVEEVLEDRLEIEARRGGDVGVVGWDQDREVELDRVLQARVLEQIGHDQLGIDVALGVELDLDADLIGAE